MLIYGWMTIACVFVLWTMGVLTYYRIQKPGWLDDVYFWLASGSFFVAGGLLEFSALRVWQGITHGVVPFVQMPAAALTASTFIFLGLTFKIRALALNSRRTGWWFLGCAGIWAAYVYTKGY